MVANINMDMSVLMAPPSDVVPIGVEHSTLQTVLEPAAKAVGAALSPHPFPEEHVILPCTPYALIRARVPAVYLSAGLVPADDDAAHHQKVAPGCFLTTSHPHPTTQHTHT